MFPTKVLCFTFFISLFFFSFEFETKLKSSRREVTNTKAYEVILNKYEKAVKIESSDTDDIMAVFSDKLTGVDPIAKEYLVKMVIRILAHNKMLTLGKDKVIDLVNQATQDKKINSDFVNLHARVILSHIDIYYPTYNNFAFEFTKNFLNQINLPNQEAKTIEDLLSNISDNKLKEGLNELVNTFKTNSENRKALDTESAKIVIDSIHDDYTKGDIQSNISGKILSFYKNINQNIGQDNFQLVNFAIKMYDL